MFTLKSTNISHARSSVSYPMVAARAIIAMVAANTNGKNWQTPKVHGKNVSRKGPRNFGPPEIRFIETIWSTQNGGIAEAEKGS